MQPVLPAGEPAGVGANVLQKEEATARPQDPGDLLDRAARIVHRAQDQGRDDRIEAVVLEREGLGSSYHHPALPFASPRAALQPRDHWGRRLGEDELPDIFGVVAEVEAGPGFLISGLLARVIGLCAGRA
jgi:hypothetical protein